MTPSRSGVFLAISQYVLGEFPNWFRRRRYWRAYEAHSSGAAWSVSVFATLSGRQDVVIRSPRCPPCGIAVHLWEAYLVGSGKNRKCHCFEVTLPFFVKNGNSPMLCVRRSLKKTVRCCCRGDGGFLHTKCTFQVTYHEHILIYRLYHSTATIAHAQLVVEKSNLNIQEMGILRSSMGQHPRQP